MSKLFTVYDPVTGKVIRTGSCPDGDIDMQIADDSSEAILHDVIAEKSQLIDIDSKTIIDAPVMAQAKGVNVAAAASIQEFKLADPNGPLIDRIAILEQQMQQVLAQLNINKP